MKIKILLTLLLSLFVSTASAQKLCSVCKTKTVAACPYGGNHKCPTCGKNRGVPGGCTGHQTPDKQQICSACKKAISACPHKGKHPKCNDCGKLVGVGCTHNGKHPTCSTCGKLIGAGCPNNGKHPNCVVCGQPLKECSYNGEHPDCNICTQPAKKCPFKGKHPNADVSPEPTYSNSSSAPAKAQAVVSTPAKNAGAGTAVDLGLPSHTLWASCNVGANSPEEVGSYYAWGEVRKDKAQFTWDNYRFGRENSLNKYTKTSKNYGDGLDELSLSDDAAFAAWSNDWCMPSKEQMDELRTSCNWSWTTYNGSWGYKVTGPNNNSIFLPATGYQKKSSKSSADGGYYWTKTLSLNISSANILQFSNKGATNATAERSRGCVIRPVKK